jgi:lysyl-tRNA synthetase class 2
MPSSVIGAHNYDPGTRRLEITFVSGKVYVYEDVAPQLYFAFSTAFSKGTFFNKFIKDRHRCQEVRRAG